MFLVYEIRVAGKTICFGRAAAAPMVGEVVALMINKQAQAFVVQRRVWSHKDERDSPFADDINHVVLDCESME